MKKWVILLAAALLLLTVRARAAQLPREVEQALPRAAEDVWARAEEDSLRGLFLRELRRRLSEASSEEERHTIQQAARYGLAALDRRDLG